MRRTNSFLLSLALLAVIGCAKSNSGAPASDSTKAIAGGTATTNTNNLDSNKAGTKKAYDIFNAKDWAKLDEVMAPDFVDHSPEPGQEPGLAGVKKSFAEFQTGFPDFKLDPQMMIAEGDMVAVWYRMTGTNSGPMMGMPATNKKVDVTGCDIIKIKNGKAVERWGLDDGRTMMMQLGLMGGDKKGGEMKKKS